MKSIMVPHTLHHGMLQVARLLGENISTCQEGCHGTANLENVSDKDENHLSSKDEGP